MKKKLDMDKIKNKESIFISTEEALKDIVPYDYDEPDCEFICETCNLKCSFKNITERENN